MTSELATTIHDTLAGYTLPDASAPYFAKVFKSEPQSLMPTGLPMARWHVTGTRQPPEGARSLTGQRMTTAVFAINGYWPLSALEGAQDNQETEVETVLIDLPAQFIPLDAEDYTVGGYPVAALTIEDPTLVDRSVPFPSGEVDMRILTFELHARLLEAS